MLHVLFEEGLTASRRRTSTGWTRSRRPSPPFTPERAEAAQRRAGGRGPPAGPRARGRGRRPRSTAGSGVSTQAVRLGLPVGGAAAQHPHRQPRPRRRRDVHHARRSTSSARGLVGRGHHDVWRSRVRGLPEFGGELPGRDAAPRRSRPRARARSGRCSPWPATRCSSTPDGARLDEALRRPGLHGRRRHLRQRDHPARRRDPAADHGAGARPLRPGLPRCWRCATPPASPRRCFEQGARRRHDWEIFREIALRTAAPPGPRRARCKKRLAQRARLTRSARPCSSACCCAAGRRGVTLAQAPQADRPASTSARCAPAAARPAADRGQADRPGAGAGGRRPGPAARAVAGCPRRDELLLIGRRHQRDNNSWMHNTERLTRGRPRHQLLMHPDDLAQRGHRGRRARCGSPRGSARWRSRWPRPTT